MENARLLIEGMELANVPEKNRDNAIAELCSLVETFHMKKVSPFLQEEIRQKQYSYGNFYNDLLYASWDSFHQHASLKGISQKNYQLLMNINMEHPALGREITEEEWKNQSSPKTSYGLVEDLLTQNEYVTRKEEWQRLRAGYYASHPGTYCWQEKDHDFLPNLEYSNTILEREIKKFKLLDKYNELLDKNQKNALAIVFHEQVMGKQGTQIPAYTYKIGQQICEANFYQYEEKLTKAERQKHPEKGGTQSQRAIYSTVNRNGRKQYISLDFRHGMMEFHDHKGTHLGEYRFTGLKNADAETSHDLTSLYR